MRLYVPPSPVVEHLDRYTAVVRDDLIVGGSKTRFLPFVLDVCNIDRFVYPAPFCGGAPVALALLAKKMRLDMTICYAKRSRRTMHPRQRLVEALGARIKWVPMGFMSHVIYQAKRYAERTQTYYLPPGVDLPEIADAPFIEAMRVARKRYGGDPDEVWAATCSGMLARCLARAFPHSEIRAVGVGLKSKWSAQDFPSNVSVVQYPAPFARERHVDAPFSIDANYEAKAWEVMQRRRKRRARVLFWNVIGDAEQALSRAAVAA